MKRLQHLLYRNSLLYSSCCCLLDNSWAYVSLYTAAAEFVGLANLF